MNSNKFKNISIRGRAAFCINCLENALQLYNLSGKGWEIILDKLWEITELPEEINEIWLESVTEYLVDCYVKTEKFSANYEDLYNDNIHLVDGEFVCKDEPHISEEEFYILKETYKHSNETINSIIERIFTVGSMEIMGGINDHSPHTLNALQDILDIMNENKIPLPDINDYTEYEYDPKLRRNDYGWGKPFDGKKLSKILKN